MNLDRSAIKSVTYYVACGPVECCDRCSAGIRNVYSVRYRDGQVQKYGSECINRILDSNPTLRSLFQKNAKLLRKYRDYAAILSSAPESMPRGSEYFDSGLYFIADSDGKDIMFGHWYFHPIFDAEKNAVGGRYAQSNPAQFSARCASDISRDMPKIQSEIARLEAFLAKILRNCPEAAA